ncbi:MAG: rhomboid family intramembrane serine protease [Flavobacteriaceae bacterium]|nr:rhomboid family intramembrane serine protease [Flavobacteriaceae bacterium]
MDKIVLIIIIANVIVSLKGFDDAYFFDRYKFQIGPIVNKEWVRMLTSGFLHVDFYHLLFNMLTLSFFADGVIAEFGIVNFLIMYFLSLLGGSALSYYYHQRDFFYSAVGASGAVSGILFSSILLYPFDSLYLMFIPIPIPAIIVGIGYLLYSVFGMKNQWGNIGHAAHLGGAATGLILSIVMEPGLLFTHTLYVIILTIPLLLLFVFRKKFNL